MEFTEIIVGKNIARNDFVAKFFPDKESRPTVPQVVIDGQLIGGYEKTLEFITGVQNARET